MNAYFAWVRAHPVLSALIQFGVLGSSGEFIATWIQARKGDWPFTFGESLLKIPAWGILGVVVKVGFTGMKGFDHALLDARFLPACFGSGLGWAFGLSFWTNLMWGPLIMVFHRIEDNLILRTWNFKGIEKAFWTLGYFWLPAHTVTFLLPVEAQIGLAALWGMVLGVILGLCRGGAAKGRH
jgi:hypothetical protein